MPTFFSLDERQKTSSIIEGKDCDLELPIGISAKDKIFFEKVAEKEGLTGLRKLKGSDFGCKGRIFQLVFVKNKGDPDNKKILVSFKFTGRSKKDSGRPNKNSLRKEFNRENTVPSAVSLMEEMAQLTDIEEYPTLETDFSEIEYNFSEEEMPMESLTSIMRV